MFVDGGALDGTGDESKAFRRFVCRPAGDAGQPCLQGQACHGGATCFLNSICLPSSGPPPPHERSWPAWIYWAGGGALLLVLLLLAWASR